MGREIEVTALGMPNSRLGASAVSITIADAATHVAVLLALPEAEAMHADVGAAIGAIKLGKAYSAGTDPRDVERRYRAKLAVRLGLSRDDIRAVFDMTEADIERLAADVAA